MSCSGVNLRGEAHRLVGVEDAEGRIEPDRLDHRHGRVAVLEGAR